MLVGMPVTLTGMNEAGNAFEEKTRTVVINRTGCKLMSEQPLAAGTRITLSIANSNRSVLVSVAWIGDKKGKQSEVGVDFDKPAANFWGVTFPEDPKEKDPREASSPNLTVTPAPAPAKVTAPPSPAPAPVQVQPTRKASPPAVSPVVSALTPAIIPPPQSPVSLFKPDMAKPETTGDLASSSSVIPITVRRPQMEISDDGLKSLGGDMLLGMVQHLVREAFQEVLTQVTEDFDRYCVTTIDRAKNAALTEMQIKLRESITTNMQPAVDAGVAGARAQLDGASRQIAAQHTQRLEATMRQAMEHTIENTEKALESRTALYDERLAATASQFCRELARRMSQSNVA
jgi:hypothetical protein